MSRCVTVNGVLISNLSEVPNSRSAMKEKKRIKHNLLDTSDAKILSLPIPSLPAEMTSETKIVLRSTAKPFTPSYTTLTNDIGSSITAIKRKKIALDVAAIAQEYKGTLFGGFVRDCLVLDQPFTDIDLWFRDKVTLQNFVQSIHKKYSGKVYKYKSRGSDYPFDIQEVRIPISTTPGDYLDIDCVLSSTFPVNDFTCNLLTYDVIKREIDINPQYTVISSQKGISHGLTKDDILSALKARQCYIFPSYSQRCKINSFAHKRLTKRSLQLKILPLEDIINLSK